MFRLKRLEIQGFKSFVDKTSLTLPTRITAIVGPNGSGKSNIADAVMWVLGEQSARALRGNTMEDVIFNGSARRRPVGMAEVSLTLESRGGAHWAETGGEVTIARRVNRDGESDYVLNGRRSRLKDVQDLLLGTGLGVRAYSIIEQQKVDLILSTKPQDRRRLIEEAAGVSKYKIRKKQAELKLEETRANLLRLSDIVGEIDRACTSLKRQASRAGRWKVEADALAGLKRTLLRVKGDRLTAAVAEAEAALSAATDAEAAALAEGGRAESTLEEAKRLADEAERRRREQADALARAREALLGAEAACAALVREAEEALARHQLLEAGRKEAEGDHLRSAEEAGRADRLRLAVEAELAEAEERARAAAQALQEASAAEQELTGRRESARRELLSAGARAAEAVNRERDAALLLDRLGFALQKLGERSQRAKEALAERQDALSRAEAAEAESAELLGAARRRLEEVGAGRRSAEERLASLTQERDAALSALRGLERRLATLETIIDERESGGEAARRALEAAGIRSPEGVLADHFDASEGFESALDAALGAALEAPILRDRAQLAAALAAVRSAKLGTARFLHPIPETPFPLKPHDQRVLGVTREVLSPRPGDEALAASLPDAVLVETADDALALAPLLPERTLVSRDGIVVRGALVEAAGTELPGEGLFTVRRELKGRGAERDALAARLVALETEIAAVNESAGELAQALDQEVSACRRAERDHSEALTRRDAARQERQRVEREVRVLEEEEAQLRADLARAGETRAEAARAAGQRNAEMATVERTIAELETGVDAARGTRLTAAEADAAARNARDVLKERRRAAAEACATHRRRADEAARRLSESGDALLELTATHQRALDAGGGAREARDETAAAAARAEAGRDEAAREAEARHEEREKADAAAHAARETLDAARKARFDAELSRERRRADLDYVLESCRAEFGVTPEELPAIPEGETPDETALSEEVARKSGVLERLGPVNHAALEEYEVESKRLQELSTQKLDLEKSLAQIQETIKTINVTSAERFQQAFASINANFSEVFKRLFQGGTASMHLLDETDPLDSGLEIMAQPPGKRNQTIGLLSGGEKALTAVALLVAIFRYMPSPFCILDEVDAPLDDANIDRFTGLLSELSEETQFVLITHSKRTMETAQALYGVTQEEPGVSKLVSVRFD